MYLDPFASDEDEHRSEQEAPSSPVHGRGDRQSDTGTQDLVDGPDSIVSKAAPKSKVPLVKKKREGIQSSKVSTNSNCADSTEQGQRGGEETREGEEEVTLGKQGDGEAGR